MGYYTNLLFAEDDARPPGYKTVDEWWQETFNEDLNQARRASLGYEYYDQLTYYLDKGSKVYDVTYAADGASVHLLAAEVIERHFSNYLERARGKGVVCQTGNHPHNLGVQMILFRALEDLRAEAETDRVRCGWDSVAYVYDPIDKERLLSHKTALLQRIKD